ncbi:MAG: hypothetical protein F4Y24_02175 [Gemmatimonadetes bacterium]|nr:hypothetical protein [Gemmatimonadota bacterium]MYJ39244.1 hypothetical protein [Gemmatimonadota bacterium]
MVLVLFEWPDGNIELRDVAGGVPRAFPSLTARFRGLSTSQIRRLGLTFLVAVASAVVLGRVYEVRGADLTPQVCGVAEREPGSLLGGLSDGLSVSRVAEYGTASDHWIDSFGGLAYHDGELFLFDHGRPEVIVLSGGSLEVVRRFGREGEGPGEFRASVRPWGIGRYFNFGFLTVSSAGVAVYDGRRVELFDLSGRHTGSVRGLPTDRIFGVRYLGSLHPEGTLVYAIDRVRRGPSPQRAFETWTMEQGRTRNLWDVSLALPPTHESGFMVPSNQAHPLWTVWGTCALTTDGASDRILRMDLATGAVDSLALPQWQVHAPDDQPIRGLPGSGAEPTARIRWEDMVVDPRGFAWVQLWSPAPTDAARVAIVNVVDGEVREVTVPVFPRAFDESGSFFAVERGSSNEAYVVKYAITKDD